MSADNRSTHTDALATLGTLLQPGEKRDAIHLGVEPAIAGEQIDPGDDVGFNAEGEAVPAWIAGSIKPVGIADPFLGRYKTIYKGQRFWLIVYPRQITSLRHVWEHPDFPVSGETCGAELLTGQKTATPEQIHQAHLLLGVPEAVALETIRRIARNLQVEPEELLSQADIRAANGCHYWVEGGRFESVSMPSDEFWKAYEIYKGKTVPNDNKGSFLSCSC